MSHQPECLMLGETRHPTSLIVVMHGLGSNAHNMRGAAAAIAAKNPGALLLLPDAPDALSDTTGRSWFNIDASAMAMAFNMIPALDHLDALINQTLAQHHLTDKNLALFGFSQGGMMALYTAYRRPNPCALTICHSSIFFGYTEFTSKPMSLMVMGSANRDNITTDDPPFYSADAYNISRDSLRRAGIPTGEYIVPGLTHMMNTESLDVSARAIRDALTGGAQLRKDLLPTLAPA